MNSLIDNLVVENLDFTNGTGQDLQLKNLSTTNIIATGTANIANLIVTNATLTQATFTRIRADIIDTDSVIYNNGGIEGQRATITNATITNIYSDNFVADVAGISQGNILNLNFGTGIGNGLQLSDLDTTNINATGTVNIQDAIAVEATSTYGYSQFFVADNLRAGKLFLEGALETNGSVQLATGDNAVNLIGTGDNTENHYGNGVGVNNYYGSVFGKNIFTGTTTFENSTTIYDLITQRSSNTEATTTNLFANIFTSLNAKIDELVMINATTTNLRVDNVASIQHLYATTSVFDQASSTYLFANFFTSPNINGNLASISQATFTNLRSETFFTSNFGFENVFATMATISTKLSVGGPFNINAPYKVNFVDNVPGTVLGDSAFSMTNLANNTSNTNSVLRLNTGAGANTNCPNGVTNASSVPGSETCAIFIDFYASSTSEINGEEVGKIRLSPRTQNGETRVVYATVGADFGEILSIEENTDFGDIVSSSPTGNIKSKLNKQIIGVVSGNTGFVGNAKRFVGINDRTVGYLGIVNTKVSTENGEIKKGDPVGIGSIAGVGVKMLNAGYIVGHAIESYSDVGVGKIEVQVAPTWYDPDVLASGKSISTSTVQNLLDSSINNSFASTTALVNTLTNSINNSIDNTVNRILSEKDFTPATSTVNNILDQVFVYAFNNSTTSESKIDLLDISFAATNTENVVEKFSFVDMQFYVLKSIGELNKKVDMFNDGVLTIASIVTDKLTAKEVQTEKLCIGQTCITEKELQELLNKKQTQIFEPEVIERILPQNETTTTPATTTVLVPDLVEESVILTPELIPEASSTETISQ